MQRTILFCPYSISKRSRDTSFSKSRIRSSMHSFFACSYEIDCKYTIKYPSVSLFSVICSFFAELDKLTTSSPALQNNAAKKLLNFVLRAITVSTCYYIVFVATTSTPRPSTSLITTSPQFTGEVTVTFAISSIISGIFPFGISLFVFTGILR